MRAHCAGAGQDALEAQAAFLSVRREEIPGLMIAAYRRAAASLERGGDVRRLPAASTT
jgi:hypothetical protein